MGRAPTTSASASTVVPARIVVRVAVDRPVGVSSRVRPADARRTPWLSPDGTVVDLPLVVDIVSLDQRRQVEWRIESTVARVEGEPRVVRTEFSSSTGLDLRRLQAEFRWRTPLDIVTRTVPALIAAGRDPYTHDYAVRGYPDAAVLHRAPQRRLSDEFLLDVARRYVDSGRGYSAVLAEHYQVSTRTVVSWVEKARERGLLGPTSPGVAGGEVLEP